MPEPRRPLHLPSLVVGVGLVVLGAALLLDALDVLDVGPGAIGPLLLALLGVALLAGGAQRRRDR